MGTGFSKRKKQAKQMQQEFAKMQEKLLQTEVTGSDGGNLVQITLNGEGDLIKIQIDKACVDPDDVEGLESLIQIAHKNAQEKLKKESGGGLPDLGAFGF